MKASCKKPTTVLDFNENGRELGATHDSILETAYLLVLRLVFTDTKSNRIAGA